MIPEAPQRRAPDAGMGKGTKLDPRWFESTALHMAHPPALPLVPFDPRVMDRLADADDRGCREWQGGLARGYGKTAGRFNEEGPYRDLRAARLIVSWSEKLDYDDQSWEARHTCDNPPCCEPSHLISGTRRQNVDDMIERGRQPRGRWRLSEEDVAEIRRLRKSGVRRAVVAERYSVHPEHVTAICSGRFWR